MASAQDQIVLYDLPSYHKSPDKPVCFSFNPWKTRIVLNYKNLPYTTQWVEYPDLAPTLIALGVKANEPGTAFADYSSPTIRLPNGEMVMHSLSIAEKLEELYPEPGLRLQEGPHLEAEKVVEAVALTVWWDGLVFTQNHCLSPRSKEYFARTRKEVFGASLEDLAAAKGGEGAWEEAEKEGGVLEMLRSFVTVKYRKDGQAGNGPYVLGREVTYADFVVMGLLECLKRCDEKGFERLMRFEQGFQDLFDACGKWVKKDD